MQVLNVYAKAKATENLYTRHVGDKAYELSDHLGNVTVTVSDLKRELPETDLALHGITTLSSTEVAYVAQVLSYTNYYAFGMSMPGRNRTSEAYRYGFNGQEKGDEIALGHTTAEYWEYDGRLGRRWNVDPIIKFYESSYATLGNNPIRCIDLDGADSTIYIYASRKTDDNGNKTNQIGDDEMKSIKKIWKNFWKRIIWKRL